MPVKVYNRATQVVEEVSSAEAQRGLQQGDYDLADKQVRVARGNRTATIPADMLLTALGQGGRLVDDAEAARVKLEREESDIASQALGTVEAAAAGATLGLSSLAEEKLFGADPEAMRIRRESAGPVATGAEIVGAALPAVLSGGSSTGASAGAAATRAGLATRLASVTPSGFVARQAARVGEGLAAKYSTGMASKIVPVGTREFIEGAAQGVGVEIDESVLGNRELAADKVLSSGLAGGLFGAGAGVAVTGLARVASGAVRAPIDGMRGVLGRSNAASGGLASREVAEMVADSATRDLSPQARLWERNAIAQGIDPETANRLARMGDSAEGRDDILRLERDRPKIERQAAELVGSRVNAVHEDLRAVQRYATGEAKVANWERQIGKTPEQHRVAIAETDALAERARGQMETILAKNAADTKRFGTTIHSGAILQQADEAVGRYQLRLAEADKLTGSARVARRAAAADMYKRELGGIIDDAGGWGRATRATPEARNSIAAVKQLYDDPKMLLTRRDVWGAAADAQEDINAAYSRLAQADDAFEDATKGTGLSTIVDPDGTINAQKAIKLVRAHGRVGGDVAVMRLMDAMDARVEYLRKIAKHVEMDDAGRSAVARVEASVEDLRREFKRQASDAGKLDDLLEARKVEGGGSPSLLTTGTSLAGLIGLNIGGPLGALGGAALVAARQPYTTLHRYAAIRSALDKADSRIGRAIESIFRTGKGIKLPKVELPRLPIGTIAGSSFGRTREQNHQRREQALARASEYLQSPDAVVAALNVPLYDVPPGIASVIQQRAQVAASFLQSKAPKVYSRGKTKLVDPVSAASFERYLEAVTDPIGALERFDAGRITKETIEAIQVVYPALYADLKERVVDELAAAQADDHEIPYDRRVRLGAIFDTPTDPSLVPQTGVTIQDSIGAQFDEPDAAAVMAAGRKPPGKLEGGSEGMQTASERTESWRALA